MVKKQKDNRKQKQQKKQKNRKKLPLKGYQKNQKINFNEQQKFLKKLQKINTDQIISNNSNSQYQQKVQNPNIINPNTKTKKKQNRKYTGVGQSSIQKLKSVLYTFFGLKNGSLIATFIDGSIRDFYKNILKEQKREILIKKVPKKQFGSKEGYVMYISILVYLSKIYKSGVFEKVINEYISEMKSQINQLKQNQIQNMKSKIQQLQEDQLQNTVKLNKLLFQIDDRYKQIILILKRIKSVQILQSFNPQSQQIINNLYIQSLQVQNKQFKKNQFQTIKQIIDNNGQIQFTQFQGVDTKFINSKRILELFINQINYKIISRKLRQFLRKKYSLKNYLNLKQLQYQANNQVNQQLSNQNNQQLTQNNQQLTQNNQQLTQNNQQRLNQNNQQLTQNNQQRLTQNNQSYTNAYQANDQQYQRNNHRQRKNNNQTQNPILIPEKNFIQNNQFELHLQNSCNQRFNMDILNQVEDASPQEQQQQEVNREQQSNDILNDPTSNFLDDYISNQAIPIITMRKNDQINKCQRNKKKQKEKKQQKTKTKAKAKIKKIRIN